MKSEKCLGIALLQFLFCSINTTLFVFDPFPLRRLLIHQDGGKQHDVVVASAIGSAHIFALIEIVLFAGTLAFMLKLRAYPTGPG